MIKSTKLDKIWVNNINYMMGVLHDLVPLFGESYFLLQAFVNILANLSMLFILCPNSPDTIQCHVYRLDAR